MCSFLWHLYQQLINYMQCYLVQLFIHHYTATFEFNHIALLPEAQKKSAFVLPFGMFEFKKVPFASVSSSNTFSKLINKVCNDLLFALGYLKYMLVFSKNNENILNISELHLI